MEDQMLALLLLAILNLAFPAWGLTCDSCAYATYSSASNPSVAGATSSYNARTDETCKDWSSPAAKTVDCSVSNVIYGKDLAARTEGTDFVYKCAAVKITMKHSFSYQGQSGDDLLMMDMERGCVAVPVSNPDTKDGCSDIPSNTWMTSVIGDLTTDVTFAINPTFESTAEGDNIICFCPGDRCNTVDLTVATTPTATSMSTKVVGFTKTTTTEATGSAERMGGFSALHAVILVALMKLFE